MSFLVVHHQSRKYFRTIIFKTFSSKYFINLNDNKEYPVVPHMNDRFPTSMEDLVLPGPNKIGCYYSDSNEGSSLEARLAPRRREILVVIQY